MRLEFNPRALCYNLYCDTRQEHNKLKQMLEKPLTARDVKSIDNMLYADTDSVTPLVTDEVKYIKNDVLVTKQYLNSIYGKVVTDMTKDYIVVHVVKNPMIIFKKSISAVEKHGEKATIYCAENVIFAVDEKYADIVKQLV